MELNVSKEHDSLSVSRSIGVFLALGDCQGTFQLRNVTMSTP